MLITKKMLLVLTLIGALIGAGIGALVTRSASGDNTRATNAGSDTTRTANPADKTPDQLAAENSSQFRTSVEQAAYRQGFDQGFSACTTAAANTQTRTLATYRAAPVRRTSNARRAYYDYGSAPRGRTFWQKHRDKLTLAAGTGGGALLGGLIGGKKGAGIGALAGLGSSALYTYKIRKRTPRRY